MYHVAEKKIPFAGPDGTTAIPKANNGIKLESFIFDVFPRAVQSPKRKASAAAASCVGGRSKSRSPTRGASPRKSDRFADLRSRSVCAYVIDVHVPVSHALTQCRCCVVLPLLSLACFCRKDMERDIVF